MDLKRRRLDFQNFDSVLQEVDQLHATGCTPVGHWDLSQVCDHLAFAFEASVRGVPMLAPWWFRTFVGPWAKRKIFAARRLKGGVKIPDQFTPKPGLDLGRTIERLRSAIKMFEGHAGKLYPHPFLGRMNYDEWRQFHLIHCGHHLGFLVPNPAQVAATAPA